MIPNLPEDFDHFWEEIRTESLSRPLDYSLGDPIPLPPGEPWSQSLQCRHFEFPGMAGRIHGWIAAPAGESRLPAFLWIPPYGRESSPPSQYSTRPGFLSLSFNFFGLPALHAEAYDKQRGYFASGIDSPRTWVFRRMVQDALLALRILQALPEVDESRVASMGMSQGGGMSIWLGAMSPIVRAVCADMPFLSRFRQVISRPVHRYPTKELTDYAPEGSLAREQVHHTLSYFDTSHLAQICKVPTHISLGLRDPAARPDNVRAVFAALPGPKALREYDCGHEWHLGMVEENRRWLEEHL